MAQSSLYDNVLGPLLGKMEILRKMLQYIKNKIFKKENWKLEINLGKNIQVKLITLYGN